jgi:putative transposase
MKVDYQERIDLRVGELKIILSEQRTITRPTKNSGTLLVKSWI